MHRTCLPLSLLLAAGCSPTHPESLLLVTFDTTRADRLGAYGGAADTSPVFDALASKSVLFETAFCPVPETLPSHVTLMTGLEPPEHGVRANGMRLAPDVPTIAEALRARGYATAAVVASPVLDPRFGLERGFDLYDRVSGDGYTMRRAAEVSASATEWLRSLSPGRPFFLWVHFIDPHHPYDPPSPLAERFRGREYEGEIAHADEGLGAILATLRAERRMESTLVCVTADHGESLGEHGAPWHGVFLYDATVRIPLLISHPASLAPRRVRGPARLVDVAPTLLDLLGRPPLPGMSGRSLAASLESDEIESPAPVYLETHYPEQLGCAPLRGLRTAEWKYVRAPRPELYEVVGDPGELRDRAAADPERVARMDRVLAEVERKLAGKEGALGIDPDHASMLAGLGYFGGLAPPRSGAARDAKDVIGIVAAIDRAITLENAGKGEEAKSHFEEVVGADPLGAGAAFAIASHLRIAGKRPAARSWAERAIARDSTFAPARVLLAELAAAGGDLGTAENQLSEAVRLAPESVTARIHLSRLLLATDRRESAVDLLREGIAGGSAEETLELRHLLEEIRGSTSR